ncbi:unnamed protein product [Lathyrus sativus]|nr:unnamed protein product [Lathyrus sativus]
MAFSTLCPLLYVRPARLTTIGGRDDYDIGNGVSLGWWRLDLMILGQETWVSKSKHEELDRIDARLWLKTKKSRAFGIKYLIELGFISCNFLVILCIWAL